MKGGSLSPAPTCPGALGTMFNVQMLQRRGPGFLPNGMCQNKGALKIAWLLLVGIQNTQKKALSKTSKMVPVQRQVVSCSGKPPTPRMNGFL